MARQVIILFLAVLVAVVTGCGGAHRYDGRLVQADSLMQANPDSALALVEAVNADSLAGEGDRAYRDLLLTQARYKCYVTATSDSDINRALNYYRNHSREREKLTRAHIYKGAVMQELGHPDSAMLYYKTAEATAAPDDYFNRGYANLRIGQLYQSQFINDSAVISRIRIANNCFQITKDTSYLITTSGILGTFGNIFGKDSARLYLNQAISLAKETNNPKGFQYQSKLAGSYFYDGDYQRAKELAMDIYWKGKDDCNENQFYYYAARSFIYLNQIDSARWLIDRIPAPNSVVDSMNLFQTMAELAQATRHYDDYVRYEKEVKIIDTRIMEESRNNRLVETEVKYEAGQHESELKNEANYRIIKVIAIILLAIALAAAILFLFIKNRIHGYKRKLNNTRSELEVILHNLEQERLSFQSERQDFISQIEEKDNELAEVNKKNQQIELEQDSINRKVADIVRHRHSAINELYHSIRIIPESNSGKKRPLLLMRTLRDLYEKRGILQTPLSQSFWDNLRYSVEGEFSGIVSFVEQQYPNLSDHDIELFMLLCAGFPNKIIKICMNYTSDVTVSKNKKKLLKEKFGMDIKFDDFIQLYLHGQLSSK